MAALDHIRYLESIDSSVIKHNSTSASFSTPSTATVDYTVTGYIDPQCRLDTFFQGALCPDDTEVSVSNQYEDHGYCMRIKNNWTYGHRPLCWFRPSLEILSRYPAVDQGSKITVGDVNDDGFQDVVIGNRNGTLGYLENDGNGNLISKVRTDAPFNRIWATDTILDTYIGDVDGDGDSDVVVFREEAQSSDGVRYFEKVAPNTFKDRGLNPELFRSLNLSSVITGWAMGDVNDDGILEMIKGKSNGLIEFLWKADSGGE